MSGLDTTEVQTAVIVGWFYLPSASQRRDVSAGIAKKII